MLFNAQHSTKQEAMKTFLCLIALLWALFSTLNPQLSAAPVGTAFTYQGQLRDGGQPATGHYDLTFQLFNDSTSGTPVAGPLTNSTAVSNGLFTATLDFGAGVFNGEARWLEIAVRTNGSTGDFTVLSPRQPVTPAPYAIHAGGVNASGIAGTIAPANIGAGSITTVMLADGAVGSNQLAVGAVTTPALADGAVTSAKIFSSFNLLSTVTLTNPAPAAGDSFGISVAAVGSDRVFIGAYWDDTGGTDAGAAYLFSANGTLLTTFTNPTPAHYDYFGWAVGIVGSDRLLIAAPYDSTGAAGSGAAYLFRTDGAWLATFTNPTPATGDGFGWAVGAVGYDRVLVGAPYADTGTLDAGAAYLFSTDGTWLCTFTNPTPANGDTFGSSVAAVGSEHVLIGAYKDDTVATNAGAAYLFRTDGTLLTTFTNPIPADYDYFGWAVAGVGSNRVLIGAPYADTSACNAGAAYLFRTNGTLLTTLTKAVPAEYDGFGFSVATVGSDRLLIGAYWDDTGATDAGTAYLFSSDGVWLAAFTNPTPAEYDGFGLSVAAAGNDRVLIGAPFDDAGAYNAGAAYLFTFDMFTPGLVAEAVKSDSVTTSHVTDGAVTLAKLDPTIGVWTRAGDDVFRLTGNVGVGTSALTSNRLEVAGMVGATAFNTTSDRAAKQDFTPVDAQAVLAKVVALPITQWRFQEFPGARHLGPMAQDFRAAFGLGHDDKSIATVDADGVALSAIQGLHALVREKDAEIQALKQRLEVLERRIDRSAAK